MDQLTAEDLAEARAAAQEATIAALRAEVTKLRIFVRYGLGEEDTLDLATGAITRLCTLAATMPAPPATPGAVDG